MAADHRRTLSLALASLALLLGLAALGTVLYLQFAGDIQPCSLCIYQRVADLAMLLAISIGFFAGRRWLWSLAALAALGGAVLAGWQWHLANSATRKVHACAAIQLLPQENFASGSFAGTLAGALAGQGSCAIAGQQRFWNLPITHWSVTVFLLCALCLLLAIFFSARRR
ncbi:disulfide bond formation protein B [Acidithiobacillus sp. CV18-2]|uniref:Disulfide bond formation protein B n=1 Tax=Igneacidithiobacillus copahuensis TaxID=2724909 RepID=A0AAE2YMP5_9PROT|nr:disulfide bond formation protein B [Igneacidithiobacillus copahuensis]MBU2755371.1 disulfide bond formation protein B [Acidithiobacillus sp. CV18-3]MBU2758589.1 disulfide bond formation protein B [Acidithiobacillus sp. BN09-2]MBU2777349.1 disulfide bond formation protein B [Acidithiobacillus sp. CV18-2]MBU2797769.1 disulfide bond formation protein B [Acidithiobacillus sp. VAN18-2]MBU2798530.1 disulfide bond formation protein B [Acidithiobacillus sp. VAN18-4]UTV80556.1 disulfide bond format